MIQLSPLSPTLIPISCVYAVAMGGHLCACARARPVSVSADAEMQSTESGSRRLFAFPLEAGIYGKFGRAAMDDRISTSER